MSNVEPHCPACRTTVLKERTLSDQATRIDVCPACKGGWFDARELAASLSVAIKDLEPPENAMKTSRVCPKCRIPLAQIDYPETTVEVDICEACHGIWLDKGEFKQLNHQRAQYQELDPPKTIKDAATRFVTGIIDRFAGLS